MNQPENTPARTDRDRIRPAHRVEPIEAAAEGNPSEELRVEPPPVRSAEQMRAQLEGQGLAKAAVDEADDEQEELKPQFTLAQLMGAMVFAAVGFALMRLTTPKVFAGVAGVMAIVGMAIISALKPRQALVHLAWWTVLAMYVVASMIAIATA